MLYWEYSPNDKEPHRQTAFNSSNLQQRGRVYEITFGYQDTSTSAHQATRSQEKCSQTLFKCTNIWNVVNEGWVSVWPNDEMTKRGEKLCTTFLQVPFIHEIKIAFIFASPLHRITILWVTSTMVLFYLFKLDGLLSTVWPAGRKIGFNNVNISQ